MSELTKAKRKQPAAKGSSDKPTLNVVFGPDKSEQRALAEVALEPAAHAMSTTRLFNAGSFGNKIEVTETFGVLRDEMTVRIEFQRSASALDGLSEHLAKRLQSDLGVKVAVELTEEGSLAEVANLGREGKPKRLLDRRYRK